LVSVESEVNKFTRIKVSLPIKRKIKN